MFLSPDDPRLPRFMAGVLLGGTVLLAATVFLVLALGGYRPLADEPLPGLGLAGLVAALVALPAAHLAARIHRGLGRARRVPGSPEGSGGAAVPPPEAMLFLAVLVGMAQCNFVVWLVNGTAFPHGLLGGVLVVAAAVHFPWAGRKASP